METLLRQVFVSLEQNDMETSNRYMLLACNLFDEETTRESNIPAFFSDDNGVIAFLKAIYGNYPSSVNICLEKIYILFNNFPHAMQDYYSSVLAYCIHVMTDAQANRFKPKCLEILTLLVQSDNLQDEELLVVYKKTRSVLKKEKSSNVLPACANLLAAFIKKPSMQENIPIITVALLNLIQSVHVRKTGQQEIILAGFKAMDLIMLEAECSNTELTFLYGELKLHTVYKHDIIKRHGNREAISFFAKYCDKFVAAIVKDIIFWRNTLLVWFNQPTKDASRAGYAALDAVHRVVANEWKQSIETPPQSLELLNACCNVLDERIDDYHKLKLAIRCMGYLAPVGAKFMPPAAFRELFINLLYKVQNHLLRQEEANSETSIISAIGCDYVEAISHYLDALKSDIRQHVTIFKRVTNMIFKLFPRIMPINHGDVVRAMLQIFISFTHTNEAMFIDFLEDSVKQGVLWTCSHLVAEEQEVLRSEQVSYKDYMPLWNGMLDASHTDKELKKLQYKLYDQLVRNLIYMSNKLNLKITPKEVESQQGIEQLEAEKHHDFVVFANITRFYCDILKTASMDDFKRWVVALSSHLMRSATLNPLVSGFYKLIATVMELCETIHFFSPERIAQKEHVRITYENMKTFIERVVHKSVKYKYDLQVSCLSVIMHAPVAIINDVHQDFSSIFCAAFKLGHANYAIAALALDTLEKWFLRLEPDVIDPLLRNVIPCLDAYLRNQFVFGDCYEIEGRKLKNYKHRKISVETEPELVQLQHKVLRFLALLPNDVCLELIATGRELKLDLTGARLLSVKLSYGERQISVAMDVLLDRVLVLCTDCTDRKIRVTACEFLHSIVAVFLGKSVQTSQSSDLDPILQKLLVAMLQLASDADATVVKLFAPLFLQLAHWYSKHSGSQSEIFIKVLMDGVSNESDASIRDQAGRVLTEFVAWTRKHNSKTNLINNLVHIKLIVDHIVQFCLHPDVAKRYGATVIFNHIYRELREEDVFVDQFWLTILYAFVMNLTLVQLNETDDDLQEQIDLCLERVARVLLQKKALFESVAKDNVRDTPPKFAGNTFMDAADFLFAHTSQLNIHCRTKCMEVFEQFPASITTRVLEKFDLRHYMHDLTLAPRFNDLKTIDGVLRYFTSLTCYLDGHIFIARLSNCDLSTSSLWPILNEIIDNIKLKNLEYVQKTLNLSSDVLVRRIKEEYTYQKSVLLEKIFDLLEVLLTKKMSEFISTNVLTIFADFLFDYQSLGLMQYKTEKWEAKASKLVKLFLDNNHRVDDFALIAKCIISNQEEKLRMMNVQTDVTLSQRQFLRGYLILQRANTTNQISLPPLAQSPMVSFALFLDLDSASLIPKLKDTQREYFALHLEVALDNVNISREDHQTIELKLCEREEYKSIKMYLSKETRVFSAEFNDHMEIGFYLYMLFRTTILKFTANSTFLYDFFSHLVANVSPHLTIKFFKDFLKYFQTTKVARNNAVLQAEIMKSAVCVWSKVVNPASAVQVLDCEASMDLLFDLRMVVDNVSNEELFASVVAFGQQVKATHLQQIHYLTRVIKALGIVSPPMFNSPTGEALKTLVERNKHLFGAETKRIATSLFIKSMFEATHYSHAFDFFLAALDLHIRTKNDFELDAAYCKEFIVKVPEESQTVLLDALFALNSTESVVYDMRQKIVFTLTLCNLLAYCTYDLFEVFFIEHTAAVLDAFAAESVVSKTLSCIFLDRLFGRIDMSKIEANNCPITYATCAESTDGKELLRWAARILLGVCKEEKAPEVDPENYRVYQCYAYNALVTLVCNAFTRQPEFYHPLFSRKVDERDVLWNNIVPLDKPFSFELALDRIPKMKKLLVNIRTERAATQSVSTDYIASQNLFSSTLAEDITNYDFADVSVRHTPNPAVVDRQRTLQIELYEEDINQHECMSQIVALLKHMQERDMLIADDPPRWTKEISALLMSADTHTNVRQFLCKVLENAQDLLKCYAPIFATCVVRTICDTCQELDGFVCDMLVMLLTTWRDHVILEPEDATALIEFVTRRLWNDNSGIFRYNVGLLKTLVETYKNFTAPFAAIVALFPVDVQSKEMLAAINAINILLVNRIAPFEGVLGPIVQPLIKALRTQHVRVYTTAAETLGLILTFLQDTNHMSVQKMTQTLAAQLDAIAAEEPVHAAEQKYLELVGCVVRHCPQFGEPFLARLWRTVRAQNSHTSQALYLQIFTRCSRAVVEQRLLQAMQLPLLLQSSTFQIQLIALELFRNAMDYMEADDVAEVMKTVYQLPGTNAVLRDTVTEIVFHIYRRFQTATTEKSMYVELLNEARTYLLSAFEDPSEEIRGKVCAFWVENDLLPAHLDERLMHLLENVYDHRNEDTYLAFSDYVLLQGITMRDEPLFPQPLHKCDFSNYQVTGHWRARNMSFMPMFTTSTQSEDFYLRATQSYNEFEATQTLASQKQAYLEPVSRSLYTHDPAKTADDDEFKNPNNIELSTKYKVQKWRFYKSKTAIGKLHALREMNKGKQINELRADAKRKQEAEVKIYRTYRVGDYPDIQISVNSLVDPLKELVRKDAIIAQLLYTSLFDSILQESVNAALTSRLCHAINHIFTTSTVFHPPLMTAFLQIALEYKKEMIFHPNVIATIAKNSGTFAYGCLLLEEYLIGSSHSELEAKRGIAAPANPENAHWVQLAQLYKCMEEWDVVHGIFSDRMVCPEEVVQAICAESDYNWHCAREKYAKLLQTDYDADRKDFYYSAFFKCCAELADWKEVDAYCQRVAVGEDKAAIFGSLWDSDWSAEMLLPYYIKAQVRNEDPSDFQIALEEISNDVTKRDYLRNGFADELAFLNLNHKAKTSRQDAILYANKFLNYWQLTAPIYTSLQQEMLLRMKNCVEVWRMLDVFRSLSKENYEQFISDTISIWEKSNISENVISFPHFTTRNMVRESVVNLFKNKLLEFELPNNVTEEIVMRLAKTTFSAEVNLIESALKLDNFFLAKKYVNKNVLTRDVRGNVQALSYLLYSKFALMKSKHEGGDIKLYKEAFKGYWKCTEDASYKETPSLSISAMTHLLHLCKTIANEANEQYFKEFKEFFSAHHPLTQFSDLLSYSFTCLRDTLQGLDKGQHVADAANAFLLLAKEYANRGSDYDKLFIECTLKSIEYGSEEARLLFPKLLKIDGLTERYSDQFIQQTKRIPTWMFIRWIPQLLAYVDTNKVSVVKDIVIALAKEYPNSMIYTYKLSKKKYTYANVETYEVTNQLDKLLHNTLVDKMLSALNYVRVPNAGSAYSELRKACSEGENAFQRVGEKILASYAQKDDASNTSQCIYLINNELISIINYKQPFDQAAIMKKIESFGNQQCAVDLGQYSPWLKAFHASNYDEEIEVPGCYHGTSRPLPHYHPKIAKFSADVKVFASKQRPIRISIYANDVKEYKFLVKHGEDLRTDEGVQQLFTLMNVILDADAKCRARCLRITTYEVIPLTAELGFIEWVDETKILKEIFKSDDHLDKKLRVLRSSYQSWVQKAGNTEQIAVQYANAMLFYNKAQTVAHYQKLVSSFSWDTLRKEFMRISPNRETFFALRREFTKSYAVMCVANWLLGVGDRHLENILVDIRRGSVIGVDYGYSFGTGTIAQALPELVPFRLTPQIVNVMAPFEVSGLFQQTMVHALRALRENCDTLLTTMEVFIMDGPTLDWATGEHRTPDVFLNLARSKFAGKHPSAIMIAEILQRHGDRSEVNAAYVAAVTEASQSVNIKLDAENLSNSDQVKCLIAQATDTHLLGRMYDGWEAWI